jgi:hypothetical protein
MHDLARQLVAWPAIAMLLLQPLLVIGDDCGCGPRNGLRATASATQAKPVAKTCCCSTTRMRYSPGKDGLTRQSCACGERCCCSANERGNPLPASPVNESRHEPAQLPALASGDWPKHLFRAERNSSLPVYPVSRPALTAQQSCALLSRFIV